MWLEYVGWCLVLVSSIFSLRSASWRLVTGTTDAVLSFIYSHACLCWIFCLIGHRQFWGFCLNQAPLVGNVFLISHSHPERRITSNSKCPPPWWDCRSRSRLHVGTKNMPLRAYPQTTYPTLTSPVWTPSCLRQRLAKVCKSYLFLLCGGFRTRSHHIYWYTIQVWLLIRSPRQSGGMKSGLQLHFTDKFLVLSGSKIFDQHINFITLYRPNLAKKSSLKFLRS